MKLYALPTQPRPHLPLPLSSGSGGSAQSSWAPEHQKALVQPALETAKVRGLLNRGIAKCVHGEAAFIASIVESLRRAYCSVQLASKRRTRVPKFNAISCTFLKVNNSPALAKPCKQDDRYSGGSSSTLAVEMGTKTVQLRGHTIELLIHDTCGQERFRAITRSYYRGADGFILVYDVTNQETFVHLDSWLQEIDAFAREDVIKIFVGNKSDLAKKKVVSKDSAQRFADHLGIPLLEASAMDATNVAAAFETIAELLKKHSGPPKDMNSESTRVDVIRLNAHKKRFWRC